MWFDLRFLLKNICMFIGSILKRNCFVLNVNFLENKNCILNSCLIN